MNLSELVITVPAPFAGVSSVGFSARYREGERTDNVPLFIEGEAGLLSKLQPRLDLLAGHAAPGYVWTLPVSLSDQLLMMGWRDRSLDFERLADSPLAAHQSAENLIRPVAFAFLRDLVETGGMRLNEVIVMSVRAASAVIEMELRRSDIVAANGDLLLFRLDD